MIFNKQSYKYEIKIYQNKDHMDLQFNISCSWLHTLWSMQAVERISVKIEYIDLLHMYSRLASYSVGLRYLRIREIETMIK